MPPHSFAADPADLAACATLLRSGSRSFHAASRFMPRATRDAATSLYAFCRVADDAIDKDPDPEAALEQLRERLRLAYDGTPLPIPADRALAALVAERAIPPALPAALLEGFAWDARARQYETISDLTAYAVRVAGAVGAMMALLMGARDAQAVARATDLGVAMQFSNIARDVGEDAAIGRLYLPRGWLSEAGVDPDAFLARPVMSAALASVIRRLLREADRLYIRAESGIPSLPASCRVAIRAARHLYAAIGHETERNGCDSISRRAVVPMRRKFPYVLRAIVGRATTADFAAPMLAEAAFLAAAIEASPLPRAAAIRAERPRLRITPKRVEDRAIFLLDLFARLERRSQRI